MFHVVLVEPRIPGNVGTIGRLCYATGAILHLVKPYGFGEITEKAVRRAGLDYWYDLEVYEYENMEDFWEKNPMNERHFLATTKTQKHYFEPEFQKGDFFYFGREDAGLPESMLELSKETCITIPMVEDARSLNIANSVSVIVYEAIKQNINAFKEIN